MSEVATDNQCIQLVLPDNGLQKRDLLDLAVNVAGDEEANPSSPHLFS